MVDDAARDRTPLRKLASLMPVLQKAAAMLRVFCATHKSGRLTVFPPTETGNGAQELPERLHETGTTQHIVTWIVGTREEELGAGPRGAGLRQTNPPDLEECPIRDGNRRMQGT
jgi:hypothetical protein